MNLELENAARIAARDCFAAKPGEKVLIVSNPGHEVADIAQVLYKAFVECGCHATLVLQEPKSQTDFAEDAVIGAIGSKPDIFVSLSAEKLGKDRAMLAAPRTAPDGRVYDSSFHYFLHGTKETRAFWSPRTTMDMFSRTVAVDYAQMRERAKALAAVLDEAVSVRVTAPSGTDVIVGLRGRAAMLDDGDFSSPGQGGNLPAGETFISPELGTTSGIIAFDGSIADTAGDIVIARPIVCRVERGFVLSVEGGEEAERLEAALRRGAESAAVLGRAGTFEPEKALRYATNARNIGELGIGLNPRAEIRGKMLEDEKVLGTCHFAIGSNYDEDAPAMIHLDGIVRSPTIVATMPDSRQVTIMERGKLLAD